VIMLCVALRFAFALSQAMDSNNLLQEIISSFQI